MCLERELIRVVKVSMPEEEILRRRYLLAHVTLPYGTDKLTLTI